VSGETAKFPIVAELAFAVPSVKFHATVRAELELIELKVTNDTASSARPQRRVCEIPRGCFNSELQIMVFIGFQ